MGRGDDPDVGADRGAAADRGELALLQDAQQPGLRLERHVADLVEEQRAALRLLEAPGRACRRAGEGALLVAEQLALDQLARDRRHVDRDERAVAALAVVVQRAGDQLLAGAALAGDQHGEVGVHQPGDDAVDLLHRRRAADERQLLLRASSSADWPAARSRGALSARSTTLTSSPRSNGLGRYSKAPRSVALTAVSSVFCALITMIRRSGRNFLMRGTGRACSRPASPRR